MNVSTRTKSKGKCRYREGCSCQHRHQASHWVRGSITAKEVSRTSRPFVHQTCRSVASAAEKRAAAHKPTIAQRRKAESRREDARMGRGKGRNLDPPPALSSSLHRARRTTECDCCPWAALRRPMDRILPFSAVDLTVNVRKAISGTRDAE